MINKKLIGILLISSMILNSAGIVNAMPVTEEKIEENQSEEIEYIEEITKSDEAVEADEIVEYYDENATEEVESEDSSEITVFNDGYIYIPELEEGIEAADESLYRKSGARGYVGAAIPIPDKYVPNNSYMVPTRDQHPYGNCWAHSAIAMAELAAVKDGAGTDIDFSEDHLTYFTYHTVMDPLGGFEGDKNWSDNIWNGGGNYDFAARALASGIGPVDQSVTSSIANISRSGIDEGLAYGNNYESLSGAYKISISANANIVKESIIEGGAVGVLYYESSSYHGPTESAASYYCDNFSELKRSGKSVNHAVAFVGWDDDYPADKMINTRRQKPAGNGAWLVRNSWATNQPFDEGNMSNNTYFWMSYEDTSLGEAAYAYKFNKKNYDNIYQYDGGFYNNSTCFTKSAALDGNGISIANIYTATHGIESLEEVSFYAPDVNCTYEISIYKGLEPGKGPVATEKKVKSATTSGSTLCEGYYRVRLNSPVQLNYGDRYSVVIEMKKAAEDGKTTAFAYEANLTNYPPLHSVVSMDSGQSYYALTYNKNGSKVRSWVDFKTKHPNDGNIRIKAFTNTVGYRVSFDGNGATAGQMEDIILNKGTGFKVPDCTFEKEGFEFAGFNTAADGSGKAYKAGDFISNEECKDIVLYAQWGNVNVVFKSEAGEVKVEFDLGGGTIPETGLVIPNKNQTSFKLCKPTKTGYTFKGWYSGKKKYTKLTQKTLKKGDLDLKAQYIENKYTIKYKLTKPTEVAKVKGIDTKSKKVLYSSDVVLASQVSCSVYGFKLVGWALSEDGEVAYKPGDVVSKLSEKKNGKVILYSVWERHQ